jgi:hypothetical protein
LEREFIASMEHVRRAANLIVRCAFCQLIAYHGSKGNPRCDLTLPLDSWKRRAANMRSADRFCALARYDQLIDEIEYLSEAVEKSAGSLEAEIDAQVERTLMEKSLAKGSTRDK